MHGATIKLNSCIFFVHVSDQVSHPYKMRDNITVQQEICSLLHTVRNHIFTVTLVGMNSIPEIILVDSYWE